MTTATGTFTVEPTPHPPFDESDGITLGRMSFEKQFVGDLQAQSHVEMISATTATPGSAGYVAIEKVRGALAGRSGSFVLQHSGTMAGGSASLSVTVVPDSATDDLAGLEGSMLIEVIEKEHRYTFDYTLPPA